MPTKTGKPLSSYYGNDLTINQSSNTGIDSTTRNVQDGFGNNTAISLSDDVLSVKAVTDNTVGTMLVKNQSGSNILAVDTTNSKVLCGSSQVNALTQYAYFSATQFDFASNNTHYVVPFHSSNSFGATDALVEISLGTGTDPATTLDVSAEGQDSDIFSNCYWYIPDAMTVTAVHVIVGGSAASATDNINFHLMKYNFDTSSNLGDLSSGVVVADQGASGVISDVHEDAIKYQSLTIDTSNNDVAAGQIVLLTVESTGTTEISLNATVKFNIQ